MTGASKRLNITRNIYSTSGQVTKETKTITIDIKKGWKQGTKITFSGLGDKVIN